MGYYLRFCYNMFMKIISWNVNGLRAVYKKGNFKWLLETSPDIFCLQETKAHPDQLPDELRNPAGYFSYFDHSKIKKGYSGVAIYSKIKPDKVEYGMGKPEFDNEGRLIVAYFGDLALINIYFPNGGGGPIRLKYKLDFYDKFFAFIEKLRKEGKKIVFCGDINTAHKEIDIARPKENKDNTGFLPVERAWMDKLISAGYADVWRNLHPDTKDTYTFWDMQTFARERNVGWRIDYFFVSPDLLPLVKNAEIFGEILGSDHCPISLELDARP